MTENPDHTRELETRLNSLWNFEEMLSEDAERRELALLRFLKDAAGIWETSCHCAECRKAYLRIIATLTSD